MSPKGVENEGSRKFALSINAQATAKIVHLGDVLTCSSCYHTSRESVTPSPSERRTKVSKRHFASWYGESPTEEETSRRQFIKTAAGATGILLGARVLFPRAVQAAPAPLTRINVRLVTSTRPGAGTTGGVYVGLCGREFGVNHGDLDFTSGHDFTYVFGDGANVFNPADNDPRNPPLDTADLPRFPRYIRWIPPSNQPDDPWDLETVEIVLNPGQASQVRLPRPGADRLAGANHLWLGGVSGTVLYLR
jgi:hypothetical protein